MPFDVVATVTNPADLVSAVNTARTAFGTKTRIVCDWNGPAGAVTDTVALRGNGSTGWLEAGGALLIEAASGKAPAFLGLVDLIGMRGVHLRGLGFARRANGGNPDNMGAAQVRRTDTFPALPAAVFENCSFGQGEWDTSQPMSEWIKGIIFGSGCEQALVKDCRFNRCYDGIVGAVFLHRVHNCDFKQIIGDQISCFGFASGGTYQVDPARYCYLWTERNTYRDAPDAAEYASLHRDVTQTGTSADEHRGYRVLARRNIAHLAGALSGGSQGFYNDDHLGADNLFVFRDSMLLTTAPTGIGLWGPRSAQDSYVDRVTIGRAGSVPSNQDFVPGLRVPDATYFAARLKSSNNLVGAIYDDSARCDDTGSIVATFKANNASGLRPEAVYAGTFSRDANDKCSYALANEGGTRAQFVAGMWAQFAPQAAYAGKGCPDLRGIIA